MADLTAITDKQVRRFWGKVKRGAPNECWEWQGGHFAQGYGITQWNRRNVGAHRVAYALTHGGELPDLYVCHSCDNRSCCNPAHLWLGTPQDNMTDMMRKGRAAGGRPARQTFTIPREKYAYRLRVPTFARALKSNTVARAKLSEKTAERYGLGHLPAGIAWLLDYPDLIEALLEDSRSMKTPA